MMHGFTVTQRTNASAIDSFAPLFNSSKVTLTLKKSKCKRKSGVRGEDPSPSSGGQPQG